VKFSDDIDSAFNHAQQVLAQEYQQLIDVMQQQILENNTAANTLACDNLRKLKFYQKLNVELDRLEDSLFDD
jgi:molecular chaperone HscB